MKRRSASCILLLAAIPLAARAQSEPPEPNVLTIHPSGEPSPALKYTLLPEPRDLVPGNAAVFYHRGLQMLAEIRAAQVSQARSEGRGPRELPENDISEWIFGPLDRLPLDEAREQLGRYDRVLREVELGVLRRDCDWEFDDRPETIDLTLGEIQSSRSLARLVSLRVRVAILDGDTEAAIHWLQAGYALARHVSNGPTIIQGLVGLAIAGMMTNDLIELIQAEGTPCLYWAIARLPDPIIDMSIGLEGERALLDRMFPDLRELDGPPWSVERSREFLDELVRKLDGVSGEPTFDRWLSRLGLAALFARTYPEARRTLIAGGFSEEKVDAMPAVQVVGLFSYRTYRERSDNLYKWLSLPYWQSYEGADRAFASRTIEEKLANPGIALFDTLQPSLAAVRLAEVRSDRQLAALRCVEAIRLYADSHDGRLPASLDAITDTPIPVDPATNNPFIYEVDGTTATLSAPLIPGGPNHPAYRINYELRLSE